MIAFFRRRAIAFLDPAISPGRNRLIKLLVSCLALLFCVAVAYQAQPASAEGSRDLYPNGATGSRANIEWRNSYYGGALLRRTLLKVYANAGEYILLGSSAIGAPLAPPNYLTSVADILVYNPGLVTGAIGSESIPATASFSCMG